MLCIPSAITNMQLYIDEIGVICDERTVASSPYINCGTANNGAVVNGDVISSGLQLAANAANEQYKFGSLPTSPVRGLVWRLSSAAATGGVYRCRFYFKGMFVETLP